MILRFITQQWMRQETQGTQAITHTDYDDPSTGQLLTGGQIL
jgi:hypothetical protein